MTENAREIFERLKTTADVPGLRGVKGTYRFDVEGVGSWRITVDDGAIWVREGAGEADCSVACPEADFLRLASGETNLMTAFMRGEVRIDGDRALLKAFHGVLRPPAQRREAA